MHGAKQLWTDPFETVNQVKPLRSFGYFSHSNENSDKSEGRTLMLISYRNNKNFLSGKEVVVGEGARGKCSCDDNRLKNKREKQEQVMEDNSPQSAANTLGLF